MKIKILLCYFLYIFHIIAYSTSSNKKLINEDIEVMKAKIGINTSLFDSLVLFLRNPYFKVLFYYRIGKLGRLLSILYPGDKTFIINSSIDGGMFPAHPFSTIINAKKIGRNFSIRQCTTIGNKIDGRNDLIPTIGNNVTVGSNVVIIGDITIGDNVIIGAGSVVVKSIPDNTIVAGNPARIIRKIDSQDILC